MLFIFNLTRIQMIGWLTCRLPLGLLVRSIWCVILGMLSNFHFVFRWKQHEWITNQLYLELNESTGCLLAVGAAFDCIELDWLTLGGIGLAAKSPRKTHEGQLVLIRPDGNEMKLPFLMGLSYLKVIKQKSDIHSGNLCQFYDRRNADCFEAFVGLIASIWISEFDEEPFFWLSLMPSGWAICLRSQ